MLDTPFARSWTASPEEGGQTIPESCELLRCRDDEGPWFVSSFDSPAEAAASEVSDDILARRAYERERNILVSRHGVIGTEVGPSSDRHQSGIVLTDEIRGPALEVL